MAVELTLTETTVEITSSTAPGPPGAPGADGADGQGVPTGGTTGQELVKASNADFDTVWATPAGGSSDAADVTFAPAGSIAATDVQAALEELDSEKAATVHVHDGGDITTGTVADARIDAAIARDSEVTAAVAAEATARDSAISTAIANLVASAPGVLDTLDEIAAALGDDPNFAATMTTALAGKQPLDSDLTAIAALSTTAYGRSLLEAANAAALRTLAGSVIGTDVQAHDSDLDAIAALSTTSFGRSLLALADAAALRTAAGTVIGTDVEAHDADLTTIAGLTPTNDDVLQRKSGAWANRTIAQLLADLAAPGTTFQPLDSDLTSIAALTTTTFGRSLLTLADAAAARTTLEVGLIAQTIYAPSSIATPSTTSGTLADVDATNAAVTFTAPASGKVLVRVSCWVDESSAGNDGGFLGLREGSSNLAGTITRVTRAGTQQYLSVPMYVSGISAGSHTYKLAFSSGGNSFRLIYQDGSVSTTKWGPLIMEVWAVS